MSLVNVLIDAQNHIDKKRTEFRLPSGSLFLSNIKITNLGFTSTSAGNLNNGAGVLSMIKQITLLDGSKTLDSIDRFNLLQVFKHYNTNQTEQVDKNIFRHKAGLGFQYNTDTGKDAKILSVADDLNNMITVTANRETTPEGVLDLSYCFDLLKKLRFVHTGMFKNFRIVIEYDTDYTNFEVSGSASGVSMLQPTILAHELKDEKMAMDWMKSFKGVQFDSMEHEQVLLEQSTPTAGNPQLKDEKTFQFHGFDNKYLKRMLVTKQPLTAQSNRLEKLSSEAQYKEIYNVRVNGSNVFPRSGIVGDNERLRLLSDVWGTCSSAVGLNQVGLYGSSDTYESPQDWVGHLDYFGCAVGNKISDLQLDYSRTSLYDSTTTDKTSQPLFMHLHGEVAKAIVARGGDYEVVYV